MTKPNADVCIECGKSTDGISYHFDDRGGPFCCLCVSKKITICDMAAALKQEKALSVYREAVKQAVTIMDEKGRAVEGGHFRVLWNDYWDEIRDTLWRALEEDENK